MSSAWSCSCCHLYVYTAWYLIISHLFFCLKFSAWNFGIHQEHLCFAGGYDLYICQSCTLSPVSLRTLISVRNNRHISGSVFVFNPKYSYWLILSRFSHTQVQLHKVWHCFVNRVLGSSLSGWKGRHSFCITYTVESWNYDYVDRSSLST